ncbi:hypothetical protein ACLOJK_039350 [Asimina triloba]
MGKIMIQNPAVGPAIKAGDLDVDVDSSFSFEKTGFSDKSTDVRSRGSLSSSDFPADFLFANGQQLPNEFPLVSNSSGRSISKDMLTTTKTSRSSDTDAAGTTRSSGGSMTPPRRRCCKSADGATVADWPAKPKHVRFRSRDDVVPPPKWQAQATPELEWSAAVEEVGERKKVDDGPKKQARWESSGRGGFLQSLFGVCRQCREGAEEGPQLAGTRPLIPGHRHARP